MKECGDRWFGFFSLISNFYICHYESMHSCIGLHFIHDHLWRVLFLFWLVCLVCEFPWSDSVSKISKTIAFTICISPFWIFLFFSFTFCAYAPVCSWFVNEFPFVTALPTNGWVMPHAKSWFYISLNEGKIWINVMNGMEWSHINGRRDHRNALISNKKDTDTLVTVARKTKCKTFILILPNVLDIIKHSQIDRM